MPLKRSRPRTEEKFQNAVVDLIAEGGCGAIGINAVAQRAGADKVLIYRYFGDLNGLWQRVADSRLWLPEISTLLGQVQHLQNPVDVIRRIISEFSHWFRGNRAASKLIAWRKAARNPLTDHFTQQWNLLWKGLGEQLSHGLEFAQRRQWACACELAALIVEADVCNQAVDSHCIDTVADRLELGSFAAPPIPTVGEATLPTNLL